ncbi:MAG TPA: peptidylprolyl isomerase [Candidatus Ozemobacteraceae bacterium]|nr:peptidylprolyl isomerase [Candidatus Ozemobacteraceae bacterium]
MKTITQGSLVAIHFTGKLENGEIFDSSAGNEPLKFKVGAGHVIDGLDEGIIGMRAGQVRDIKVTPEKGFGSYEDSSVLSVERAAMGKNMQPKPGMLIDIQTENGQRIPGTIVDVTEDTVKIDLNHPLAGKNLNFNVEVVEVHDEGDPGTENWGEHDHGGCCGEHEDGCCGEHDHGCCGENEGEDDDEGCCGTHGKGGNGGKGGCCGGH